MEIETAAATYPIAGVMSMTITLKPTKCDAPMRAVQTAESDFKATEATLELAKANHAIGLAGASVLEAQARRDEKKSLLDKAQQYLAQVESDLAPDQLPNTTLSPGVAVWQAPIVSVNGSALDLPYEVYHRDGRVQIRVNVKEALLTDGGGVVKVSWPFYRTDRWTSTYRYYRPALGFQVTRVSEKSILISRINGLSFSKAPENLPDNPCWKLIAGDTAIPLRTEACVCPPVDNPRPCQEKKQKATKAPTDSVDKDKPLDLGADLPYTVSATVAKMPSHAVLLAPNGTAYRIDIPDLTDKKDTPSKPIEMKQYDSTWIPITLPVGKVADKVEANGKYLNIQLPAKPDPKVPQTIRVEITRDLTAKTGTLDLTALDKAGNPIPGGTQKITISCSQCTDKGDK